MREDVCHTVFLRRSIRRGFTLIEITIALSILVLALSILVENQGFAAYMTRDAEKIRIATMLALVLIIRAIALATFRINPMYRIWKCEQNSINSIQ